MESIVSLDECDLEAGGVERLANVPRTTSPSSRESLLLWCIGSIFGLGMVALLVAMCIAEVSIHRDMSGLGSQPINASHGARLISR